MQVDKTNIQTFIENIRLVLNPAFMFQATQCHSETETAGQQHQLRLQQVQQQARGPGPAYGSLAATEVRH